MVSLAGCTDSTEVRAALDTDLTQGNTSTEFQFDAGNTSVENSDISSYQWDFGDGSSEEGEQVNHTFARGGEYDVKLTVEADDGTTATDNVTVTVCDLETVTDEEVLLDEWGTVAAGQQYADRFDLTPNDRLIIDARMTDGARPSLLVEDSDGSTITGIGPDEHITYTLEPDEEGRYFVYIYNDAIFSSGEWEVEIIQETDYEEEVC